MTPQAGRDAARDESGTFTLELGACPSSLPYLTYCASPPPPSLEVKGSALTWWAQGWVTAQGPVYNTDLGMEEVLQQPGARGEEAHVTQT